MISKYNSTRPKEGQFMLPFALSTDLVEFKKTILRKLKVMQFLYIMILGSQNLKSKLNLLFNTD